MCTSMWVMTLLWVKVKIEFETGSILSWSSRKVKLESFLVRKKNLI